MCVGHENEMDVYERQGRGGGERERERETNSITTCKVVTKEAAEGANIILTNIGFHNALHITPGFTESNLGCLK